MISFLSRSDSYAGRGAANLPAGALSEGEIDPKLENKQVILAYEEDGKPLDAPRLVVPGDLHAPRGVHDVVSISVQ